MNCFFCRADAGRIGSDVAAVLCGDCVQRCTGAPDIKPPQPKLTVEEKTVRKIAKAAKKVARLDKLKTAKRGRGRGWHLKKLFEFDGQYFSMGESITAVEANKLRKALAKEPAADPFKLTTRKPRARKIST